MGLSAAMFLFAIFVRSPGLGLVFVHVGLALFGRDAIGRGIVQRVDEHGLRDEP